MRTITELTKKLQELKPDLNKEFHVSNLGVFGSYAVGSQTENSDIDILVEFEKTIGWKFFTLEIYLEKILKRKIDLVTKDALKEQFKDKIMEEVIYI